MGCLYKLTSPSGKAYVGITLKDFIKRWKQHIKDFKRGLPNPLYRAMRKYGPDRFLKDILAYSDNPSVLLAFEARAATVFNCLSPHGYNICAGGRGNFVRSEESRENQSEKAKLRFSSPAERRAQSERIKKTWQDPLFRSEMTELRKRVGAREDFKSKARAHMAEQRRDPEFVKKCSLAQAKRLNGLWADPNYRASQLTKLHSQSSRDKAVIGLKKNWGKNPNRKTRKGQKNSAEQNAAIGRANKLAYADPVRRAALAKVTKDQWADPIKRAKRLEAIKSGWAKARLAKQTP